MKNISIALLIGICAGIIDVIPMIIQKLDWHADVSAFLFWVALGVVIPYVSWNIKSWLKGLIVAELFAIPIIVITLTTGFGSVFPIMVMSALLGTLVGIVSKKFIV